MFTPTKDPEDQISFMDSYSNLLSPFTYFEIDGYNNIPNYCHDESALLSGGSGGGNNIAESSNEFISASSKMGVKSTCQQGDHINGIVEQDNNSNNLGSSKQMLCRKRCSKGDRHSKIPTAKGLRDRRMRLCLDVARQFFKLQDMLSYDKASQTVEWLLVQAKSAIEELKEAKQISPSSANGGKFASPSCELGEEVVENSTIHDKIASDYMVPRAKDKLKETKKSSSNREAKELRKKARERARERTYQKKQASIMSDPRRCLDELQSTQCNPAQAVSVGSRCPDVRPSLDLVYMIEQQIQDEIIPFEIPQDFAATPLVVNANWSHLMSLNYHQEDQTCQMISIPEFEFHGASWEPYNYSQYWDS